MMKLFLFVIMFVFALLNRAQVNLMMKFNHDKMDRNSFYQPIVKQIYFPQTAPKLFTPLSLNFSRARQPFFCNLEDKFRKRFNVFLKLRVGNDDSYRQMISPING